MIAIVDGCPAMRIGLVEMLKGIGGYKVVVRAKNGAEYRHACKRQRMADLAIVDLNMPEMDGYVTLAWMHEHQSTLRPLAITHDPCDAVLQRAYKVHARGVLSRTVDEEELRGALHNVITGGFLFNSYAQRRLAAVAGQAPADEQKAKNKLVARLSDRQKELLKWMCHPDRLSYAEIADQMGLKPSSVETLRKRIRDKIGFGTRHELMLFAHANDLDR